MRGRLMGCVPKEGGYPGGAGGAGGSPRPSISARDSRLRQAELAEKLRDPSHSTVSRFPSLVQLEPPAARQRRRKKPNWNGARFFVQPIRLF
jgi:hypothetical protein